MNNFISSLSGKEFPISERIAAGVLNPALFYKIKEQNEEFSREDCIAVSELDALKLQYLSEHLEQEVGNLSSLEKTVLQSIGNKKSITAQLDDTDDAGNTMGQRIADKVASFGGSWSFIIIFTVIIVVWIASNTLLLQNKGFDPYPFILLNLILSCLAALQAPVIMMSQNRQEEKDRERAKSDYMINLKSELEIRMLHEKLDHLIMRHQEDIIELQKVQLEQMNNIISKLNTKES